MMSYKTLRWRIMPVLVLTVGLCPYLFSTGAGIAQDSNQMRPEVTFHSWQSPAQLRHIVGKQKGNLTIDAGGLEFQPQNGLALKWPFLEIQTFHLSLQSLAIETYGNRKGHLPGMQRYRFDLDQKVPAPVAAELAREVQRPSQNAIPDPGVQSVVIAAHHRTRLGGTNGTLRFRDDGIDFVSSTGSDSRSWRWADLQTLSNPDRYHLFLFGFRDTYAFDLKEPLSRQVFNHISDEIWRYNESEMRGGPVSLPSNAPASANYGSRNDE